MVVHVSKSRFKAKALELMRQVEASGEPIVITDHGKPALELKPIGAKPARDPLERLRGSLLFYDRPFDPVDEEEWDTLK
ncbi:type II toxin-antitoxin system prevent-host-death family antitoxin [Mesorhizobium microcysteis]|uniref:Antitoxin n=1 Tax=Neoaquamicrobium microcysteis TaxID=2682781 RepID=A0A5D4H3V0_9HYPH|nr:type II toxin-antitoxin system prevent-host-death family antitoxin [Mesorhizobium microcysteis]TYR34933.1 type II toxin-antitoxin system prevent-host-death family antitoxin [Mesorhizobium microcysteis]